MAFNPPSLDELERAIRRRDGTDRDVAERLSVIACGGQGRQTDNVTRSIRDELPAFLMRHVAMEAAAEARRKTLTRIKKEDG